MSAVPAVPAAPASRADRAALRAARAVVALVGQHGLVAGDRLPTEAELQVRFGCGRATLREAMRLLEGQGVLELRRGRTGGPVVALPDEAAFVRQVETMLLWAGASVGSIAETRLAVEPVSAQLAAERCDAADLAGLERNLEALRAVGTDWERAMTVSREFHDLVGLASGNVLLACLGRSFDGLTAATDLGTAYAERAVHDLLGAHERIAAAIARGDGPGARAAMSSHLEPYAAFAVARYGQVSWRSTVWGRGSRATHSRG